MTFAIKEIQGTPEERRKKLNARQYYFDHIEKSREDSRRSYAKHRDERLAVGKRWYQEHREERAPRYREYNRTHIEKQDNRTARLKEEVLARYGNGKLACVECGFDDVRALSLDHIDGDGSAHRKAIGGSAYMYRWVKRNGFPEGFQTLCLNCNWIKRDEEMKRLRTIKRKLEV